MIDIQITRLMLAAFVGTVVTVGFDATLHGLSHGGHGFLDRLWEGESAERTSPTRLFSGIGWHIMADVLIAILISLLIALIQQPSVVLAIVFGLCIGGLRATQWVHAYAAFETGGRVISSLALLSFIQTFLASLVISLIYWGV